MKLGGKHLDLRIAAIVLKNSAKMANRNVAGFRMVPELTIEEWSVYGGGRGVSHGHPPGEDDTATSSCSHLSPSDPPKTDMADR